MQKIHKLLVSLLLYTTGITIFSFIVPITFFSAILLWYGIPSVYISLRIPYHIKKSLIFSLLVLPLMIIIDYISHITKTWLVPHSIIDFRLFGFVTLEIMLWSFFYVYYVTVLFEYQQNEKKSHWHPRMSFLVALMIAFSILFIVTLYTRPTLLNIPYFYLLFGTIFVAIPIITALLKYPSWFSKIYKIWAFSLIISTLYEISALKAGWWAFPGTRYLGWIEFFGVRFPHEELVFWILMLTPATIIAYQFFHGKGKPIISIDTKKLRF